MSPKRVDANQASVVDALRRCGCKVQTLHTVGDGCPDLLVGWHGLLFVVEVKDGDKPPSKQKLTEDEVRWHGEWKDERVYILNSVERIPGLLQRVETDYYELTR